MDSFLGRFLLRRLIFTVILLTVDIDLRIDIHLIVILVAFAIDLWRQGHHLLLLHLLSIDVTLLFLIVEDPLADDLVVGDSGEEFSVAFNSDFQGLVLAGREKSHSVLERWSADLNPELFLEEPFDASNVSFKLVLGLRVLDRDNLWEVNNGHFPNILQVYEEVEFVEVTVNESASGKSEKDFEYLVQQRFDLPRFQLAGQLVQWNTPFHVLHEDCVATVVDGTGNGESRLVESLHVLILLFRSEAGQVQPAGMRAALEVVALALHGSERDSTKTVKLDYHRLVVVISTHVDVALLTDTDSRSDRSNNAAVCQRAKR